MGQLYESGRRRLGFTAGVEAELADGQVWTFPRVRIRLSPRRAPLDPAAAGPPPETRHTVSVGYAIGGMAAPARYQEWCDTITAAKGPAPNDVYWDARMDAAATLLRINYDLSDEELAELLWYDDDDPASVERWHGIDLAILGRAPKATPAT